MASVRLAAVNVLLNVERRRTTLPDALDRERRAVTDRRDRALLLELTAGTLRWRNAVDFALADASDRPLAGMAAPVRAILRLGTFQLRHLDRVPDHAVLNEAVALTRKMGHPRAAGFVNAVLRTVVRRRAQLRLPERPAPEADRRRLVRYLSITLSHPEWLVTRWLDRYGFFETEAWCAFNNEPPAVTVRSVDAADDLGTGAPGQDVPLRPARYVSGAFHLDPGGLGLLPDSLRARLIVQDEGSQLVACLTPVHVGGRTLDLCAAPGNKTIMLAERAGAEGIVVSCDHRQARVAILVETLRRAGCPSRAVRLDATHPLPFADIFDTVMVDAPCSGLGTLRRDPDLKWSRTEADLGPLATQQARLLSQAAAVVRPGGSLVYATCSSEPEENDAVVDAFLEGRTDFEAGRLEPGSRVRHLDELVDARGRLHTLPSRHRLDAFFAAVLVRRRAA